MMILRDRAENPLDETAKLPREWITTGPGFYKAICSMLATIRIPQAMNLAAKNPKHKLAVSCTASLKDSIWFIDI
jgi:hypothetical protein